MSRLVLLILAGLRGLRGLRQKGFDLPPGASTEAPVFTSRIVFSWHRMSYRVTVDVAQAFLPAASALMPRFSVGAKNKVETSLELQKSSLRFGVAQENVLSPFRIRDHSLTVAARCRRTSFPSRAREQAVQGRIAKFHHFGSSGSRPGRQTRNPPLVSQPAAPSRPRQAEICR
jgi:hypothetical protein